MVANHSFSMHGLLIRDGSWRYSYPYQDDEGGGRGRGVLLSCTLEYIH